MLITRDIGKIKRADSWTLAAPECHVNLKGEAVFETYKPDSFLLQQYPIDLYR